MLREYFVARDELNEINGLPEDVVDAELSYLAPLVELMGESSDDLLAALFDRRMANIARRVGRLGGTVFSISPVELDTRPQV